MTDETFERVARTYGDMLYRVAYHALKNRADAEDVMQEVFVRLLRARPEFRDEEHAKAWLLRVGARCAADVLRAPWRRREGPLDDALPAPEPVPFLQPVPLGASSPEIE